MRVVKYPKTKSHAADCPGLFIGIIYHVMSSIERFPFLRNGTNVSLRCVLKNSKEFTRICGSVDRKKTVSEVKIQQIKVFSPSPYPILI